jgi:hypothetical protein
MENRKIWHTRMQNGKCYQISMLAIILRARRPCRNQTKVIKAVGFLGVARHNRRKPQCLSI